MITLSGLGEIRNHADQIAVTYGVGANRLYYGCILREAEDDYKIIVNSSPIFESSRAAREAMAKIINFASHWVESDLRSPACPLQILLCQSPEEYKEFCRVSSAIEQPA